MTHEVVNQMGLAVHVRHLSYTDPLSHQFAATLGLIPGTAKDVAKKVDTGIDWEKVHQLIETPPKTGIEQQPTGCCGTAGGKWSPALDAALKPCEQKAVGAGIMMTPVFVVCGQLMQQGSVPSREKIHAWIEAAFGKEADQQTEKRLLEVLGSGCKNCETLYENVFKALSACGLRKRVSVKKIADINYFAAKGVHATPGLILDGTVISQGRVLAPDQIIAKLNESMSFSAVE